MKRFTAILLSIFTVFALTACQPTPEAAVVVRKDTDKMIEKAQSTPATTDAPTLSLKERYAIPDALSYTQTGASGKLNISVEAVVTAPNGELPIVRVEAAEFSQETVTAFWNAFIGDTPMFEQNYVQTKSDIEKAILYYKQVQAGMIDGLETPEEAQEKIDTLEAAYPSAPDSVEPVPATPELKRIPVDLGEYRNVAHYYGLHATNNEQRLFFNVHNHYDNTKAIEIKGYDRNGNQTGSTILGVSRRASLHCMRMNDRGGVCYINADAMRMERGDALPEQASAFISLTPAEAAAAVEAFIAKVGLADVMAVSDIYLCNDRDELNGRPEASAFAYEIFCTRLIHGTQCANILNAHESSQTAIKHDAFAPTWGYESFKFRVDDTGIFDISWTSPVASTETVTEDSALKPFHEIEEIAKKMLPIIFEPDAKDKRVKSIDISIDRVTLSLWRIAEQDRFDHGLYIPVWNFFGTRSETITILPDRDFTNVTNGAMLTINAIDGSIIDVELGY